MKVTIPYIEKKFEEFNQLMFAGRLPKLPIELSNAKTFIGMCVYKKRKLPNGEFEKYDFRLRINTRIDLSEAVIEDTIIHEMIHYFIDFNKLEDSSAHGPVFQHIMNTINEKFGRNLTIAHKASKAEQEQLYDTRKLWHVVAIIYFKDGKTGVKVLPRIEYKIVDFCSRLMEWQIVSAYQLYMTNNPFFNRFPTSTALRISPICQDELKNQLESAEELTLNNNHVVKKNK